MAVDEVLLASAGAGAPPALRLYAWRGPWLSLGYAQPFDEASARACRAAGVEVVRRVTGGRAVLHGGDLTYAVVAREASLPPGLEGSYRLLSDALLAALASVGVAAERAPAAPAASSFDCFAAAATDEICAEGRKLAGSAQRRAAGAVLQHGSIRLRPDPPEAARVAGLGAGATTLAELGIDPEAGLSGLRAALPRALAERLGVEIAPATLDPAERRAARARALALRRDPLARRALAASRAP